MPLLRAGAHEVRDWTASCRLICGFVCYLSGSADVFLSHFLRDFERLRDFVSSGLPSFVATQSVPFDFADFSI